MEYATTHFNVLGQTRWRNPSTHTANAQLNDAVVGIVSQKLLCNTKQQIFMFLEIVRLSRQEVCHLRYALIHCREYYPVMTSLLQQMQTLPLHSNRHDNLHTASMLSVLESVLHIAASTAELARQTSDR